MYRICCFYRSLSATERKPGLSPAIGLKRLYFSVPVRTPSSKASYRNRRTSPVLHNNSGVSAVFDVVLILPPAYLAHPCRRNNPFHCGSGGHPVYPTFLSLLVRLSRRWVICRLEISPDTGSLTMYLYTVAFRLTDSGESH